MSIDTVSIFVHFHLYLIMSSHTPENIYASVAFLLLKVLSVDGEKRFFLFANIVESSLLSKKICNFLLDTPREISLTDSQRGDVQEIVALRKQRGE